MSDGVAAGAAVGGAMAQSGAWKKAKTNSKLVIAAKTAAHQARAARRAAARREGHLRPLRGISLESGGDRSIQEQLRDALVAHAVRVIDLFKEGASRRAIPPRNSGAILAHSFRPTHAS